MFCGLLHRMVTNETENMSQAIKQLKLSFPFQKMKIFYGHLETPFENFSRAAVKDNLSDLK